MAEVQKVVFGQHLVNPSQVFYRSQHCLGLVNLMPVVKGTEKISQGLLSRSRNGYTQA